MILDTRLKCLSSLITGADIYASIISIAVFKGIPPNAITFALLWVFAFLASSSFVTLAHNIPFTLFAAIETPIPFPHITIPNESLSFITLLHTSKAKSG